MKSDRGRARLIDFRERVAFITGGSSGIGLGIGVRCLEAGMKVVLTYRTPRHLRAALKSMKPWAGSFEFLQLDVMDRSALAAAERYVSTSYGQVNLLCANAGVGVRTPIAEADFDDWDFACGVNINGVFNTIKCFIPSIIAGSEPAHILSTASMSGLFHGSNAGVYTATKFAVVGMTEALRAELMHKGIGVSICCPGLVKTRIHLSHRGRSVRSVSTLTRRDSRGNPRLRRMVAAGMDHLECAQRILEGVRRNDMYILTHPEFEQGIRDRFQKLLAALPKRDTAVPANRTKAERFVLRHKVYSADG